LPERFRQPAFETKREMRFHPRAQNLVLRQGEKERLDPSKKIAG
jgi:hypothetical protein